MDVWMEIYFHPLCPMPMPPMIETPDFNVETWRVLSSTRREMEVRIAFKFRFSSHPNDSLSSLLCPCPCPCCTPLPGVHESPTPVASTTWSVGRSVGKSRANDIESSTRDKNHERRRLTDRPSERRIPNPDKHYISASSPVVKIFPFRVHPPAPGPLLL